MSFPKNQGSVQINAPLSGEFGTIYVNSNLIDIQNRSATVRLGNEPTLNVSRQSNNPINLSGYTCVNFSASGAFIIQSSSLVVNQIYLFNNSSGFGQVNLSLDDKALLGGLETYTIIAGQFVEFMWDGANLNLC